MNKYGCRNWKSYELFNTVEADSMHQAAEYYVRRDEKFFAGLGWKEQDVTVEVKEESGQVWIVNVRVEPVYQYRSTHRRKLEAA